MPLFALGLNHQTAPLAIRERVAIGPERVAEALAQLQASGIAPEAAIISTCNRSEIYCAAPSAEAVATWFAQYHGYTLGELAPYLYTHAESEAVQHVFRVACGLDSMVLGEAQILGQLKDSVRQAESAGSLGSQLHKLFQHSFTVAKSVRSNTAIGANIVSMAAAAVHLSSRIFESIAECRVLFIGAGEMIDLCAHHFAGAQPKNMVIANRSLPRAQELAQRVGATAIELESIADGLHAFDIVVSCTASPLPIIGRGMAERAIKARRHRPMVMVDLAVPRDIEAEVAKLPDVFLYTVDDLSQIVNAGREARSASVVDAESIIAEGVQTFAQWQASRGAVPAIRALREQTEALRQQELERALRLLARGEDPAQVLDALSQGLCNKFLHAPMHYLNQADKAQSAHIVQAIFQLKDEPPKA